MRTDTLYVSDMDGTLLDNAAQVSLRTASIISGLTDAGAMITVATARTPATVDVLLRGTRTSLPAIVMTGAAMWSRSERRYTDMMLMQPPVASELLAEFADKGVSPFVYTMDADERILQVYHTHQMNYAESQFYQSRRELPLKHFNLDVPVRDPSRVVLMFGTGAAGPIMALADALRRRGDCSVSCYPDTYNHDVALIEVFAPGVSKAAAVRRLAGGCRARRVVVFGDNLNDLPMMSVADVSVAVGNALPQVRDKADCVIDANSTDAVARFIESD